MNRPQPVRVPITDIDTIEILRTATTRHDQMTRRQGAYGYSTMRSQDVGLLGERATAVWLTQQGADVVDISSSPALQRRHDGDIGIARHRRPHDRVTVLPDMITIEVKTSRFPDWRRYGRTLDTAQLTRSTADAYAWAVAADRWPGESVILMGWLPTAEIRAPGATETVTAHHRPHARVVTAMRPMADLLDWVFGLPRPEF